MKRICLFIFVLIFTFCFCTGCDYVKSTEPDSIIHENDRLEIEIKGEKYYVLEVEKKDNSILKMWESTLFMSCKGHLTTDGKDMVGTVRLDTAAFSAPADQGINGVITDDGWRLTVLHYERTEEGGLTNSEMYYLIYGFDNTEQNGVLIRIYGTENSDKGTRLFAVKGDTKAQAEENFRILWDCLYTIPAE